MAGTAPRRPPALGGRSSPPGPAPPCVGAAADLGRRGLERRRQQLRAHGLGQVVVHARGEAHLAVAAHGVRRHRDDPQRPVGPLPADPPGRLEAVHLGHLHVHQDDVVRLPLDGVEHLEPVLGDVRRVADALEEPERELHVHGVVLGQEDPQRVLGAQEGGSVLVLRGGRGAGDGVGREHRDDRVEQRRGLDRLGELLRDGVAPALARADGGEDEHRDRWLRRATGEVAHRLGQLDPVEVRHVEVEDREVEPLARARPGERLQRRPRVRGDHPPARDLGPDDPAVRLVVVDDEDAAAGELLGRDGRCGHDAGRLVGAEPEVERGALALDAGAVRGQRPVHQLGEPAADREPEARAAIAARDRRVHLAERLEQAVHPVRGDADPGVPDVEGDLPGVDVRPAAALDARAAEPQLDLAVLRELEGVGQQVERDLADAARIADEPDRQVGIDRVHELQSLLRRHRRHQVEGALDRAPQLERLVVQLDLAGLDLGEVEDVVDDREQGVGRRLDRLGVVRLLGVQLRVLEQAAHADDRVHRRPDLVAHRGEERGLGEVRLLGGAPGGQGVLVEPGVVDRDRRLVGRGSRRRRGPRP